MTKEERVIKIKEHIDAVYGADCAYYNVDGFAIADELDNAGYRKISDVVREIFEKIDKIIDEKYNKFVFGSQQYESDEETDAIINYSDTISDALRELRKEYINEEDL